MNSKILIVLLAAILFGVNQKGIAQPKHLMKIGVSDSLYSDILEEQREIWVQLPESFNPSSKTKYPVIYVLDGGVHLNAVYTVLNYYWGGFIPEMVIVGISNRENRIRDLTTSVVETRREIEFKQETGGAEIFTSFIETELIPYIDNKYPVTDYRTLIGHSYAGLFTVNTLINHTDLFVNYLAIDPSFDWDDQKLLKQSTEVLSNKNFDGVSLYISMSGQLHLQNDDITFSNVMQDSSEYTLFARSILEFSHLLEVNKQNGLNFQWKFYESDLHGTLPLPSIMDGLIYLFNWFPIENTDMFNSPETPKEALIQLIRNREMKLAEHFGYSIPPFDEGLLNMLGYMNMDWGELEKSLALFQLCIEYYPLSANAYDSMADYYESQKDYSNALKNVSRAYEISGDEYLKTRMEELKLKDLK